MTARFLCALLVAVGSLELSAQQSGSQAEKKPQSAPRTLTLTGCVEKGGTPNQFTLQDEANGKYEVSGSGINKFVGKRVQIAGTPGSNRFRVKGGLWPTPNVAGQAGAIDPAKAAIASQPGGGATGTGDIALPTLKVRSIRALDGGCE